MALHAVGPRGAHQLRVGHRNRRRVAGHIDFRHHANAAVRRVAHHLFHLRLSIKQPVAGLLLQFRIPRGSEAPALIVGQMPVENVQFSRRHAVNLAFNSLQRYEVASGIQQQPAPREARRIINRDVRNCRVFCAVLHQLEQRFHPAHRAKPGIRLEGNALGGHLQLVAFITVRTRNRRHFFGHHHVNCRRGNRRHLRL